MFIINILLVCLSSSFVGAYNLTNEEILAFDAPKEIRESFPYFLSGYDDEEAPIWILEAGKWDMRKYVEQGGELHDAMDIYFRQMFLTFRESALNSSAKQFVEICDMDGFDIRQAGDAKSMQFFMRQFVNVAGIIGDGSPKQIYIINANALVDGIWQVGSPLLGGSLKNSYEFYGTNKAVWMPKLLKRLPKDQLPEKFGGSSDHKPIKTFG